MVTNAPADSMSNDYFDPRPHLNLEERTDRISLGDFDADGLEVGCPEVGIEISDKLSPDLRAEYRQARREGFVPVLVTDLMTGVAILEMRKHCAGNN
jgi:hypothetical protein